MAMVTTTTYVVILVQILNNDLYLLFHCHHQHSAFHLLLWNDFASRNTQRVVRHRRRTRTSHKRQMSFPEMREKLELNMIRHGKFDITL